MIGTSAETGPVYYGGATEIKAKYEPENQWVESDLIRIIDRDNDYWFEYDHNVYEQYSAQRGMADGWYEEPVIIGWDDSEDTNALLFAADFDYVVADFQDTNVYSA